MLPFDVAAAAADVAVDVPVVVVDVMGEGEDAESSALLSFALNGDRGAIQVNKRGRREMNRKITSGFFIIALF